MTHPQKERKDLIFLSEGKLSTSDLAEIYTIYSKFDSENVPGCAFAIYQNGKSIYRHALGAANVDHGIPLSDSSRFYMASLSKQVTAATAGLLILRGKLSYDAAVSSYFDDWPEWAADVRVKHLFNHTSGLPDIYDLMEIAQISLHNVMSLNDYYGLMLKGEALKNHPGTEFSYTNSGYTVLALLIERISGLSFAEFAQEALLSPLGMNQSHFHDNRYTRIPNRVLGYEPADNGADTVSGGFRMAHVTNFQGVGPGGLYSSLRDWEYWESFWFDTHPLSPEFKELRNWMMQKEKIGDKFLEYGIGFETEIWKGTKMNGHSGNFMGFQNDVRRFPEHGLSFLTLCNRRDARPAQKNRSLAKILMRDHFQSFIEPYEGEYFSEELQAGFMLHAEKGSLTMKRRLSPTGAMSEESYDKWRIGSWELLFQRNKEGEVTGVMVSTGRANDVLFIKK